MTQTNDWRNKYFTDEQLQQMEELYKKSYTDEQRAKLAEWGKNWTEADQQVADQKWGAVIGELQHLTTAGADPASAEAQAFAKQYHDLINQFTHGDPGIAKGLGKLYDSISKAPAEEVPFPVPYSKEEGAFLEKVLKIYQQHQG